MTATTIGTAARTAGIIAVLVAAAILGLVVGNALQGRSNTTFGYPAGYSGGAAAPGPAVVHVDHLRSYLANRGDVEHVDHLATYLDNRGNDVEYVDHLQDYLAGRADAAETRTPTSPTPR